MRGFRRSVKFGDGAAVGGCVDRARSGRLRGRVVHACRYVEDGNLARNAGAARRRGWRAVDNCQSVAPGGKWRGGCAGLVSARTRRASRTCLRGFLSGETEAGGGGGPISRGSKTIRPPGLQAVVRVNFEERGFHNACGAGLGGGIGHEAEGGHHFVEFSPSAPNTPELFSRGAP